MAPAVLLPPHQPPSIDDARLDGHASDLLSQTLSASPYAFLQPSPQLHSASLQLAKHYLDPLAASVSESQAARLHESRRKRKRGEPEDHSLRDVLRLKQLHLDGFAVDQVWEQAKRVIDASHREVQRGMQHSRTSLNGHGSSEVMSDKTAKKTVAFADEEEQQELDESETNGVDELEDPSEDFDDDLADEDDEEMPDGEDQEVDGDDHFQESSSLEYFDAPETVEEFVPDKHGLNDGFFSIDDFNRQTEFLEYQDARGDPDDGAASDEEDIDWTLDPTSQTLPQSAIAAALGKQEASEEESADEDEDGPTFGNADLSAPFESSDEDGDDEIVDDDLDIEDPTSNTNEIFYGDFFEPPARPKSKSRKPRAKKPQLLQPEEGEDAVEADIQRAISSVRRDIFDEDEISGSEDEDVKDRNLSSHERRQAALAAQIRALEAEAVAKREWTMSGEARAVDRPMDSLLEQDLEFERAGKPVPVVTAETSASIEDLIKQRILARQFDEVTKRLPGSEALSSLTARRGLVDIDTKEEERQGLADLYETEHQRLNDPNYVDKRDAKLKAAHAEIERLWKDVSSKLDALSNWHYRPKPADVEVTVVTDAPRITMEDARPGGVGVATEQSGLAPQEVYKAGSEKSKDEVVTKAGAVVGRAELSREDKRSRRRREKSREKKKASNTALKPQGASSAKPTKAQDKKDVVDELKRGGVKVIGKQGQLVDVEGHKVKAKSGPSGAGHLKL